MAVRVVHTYPHRCLRERASEVLNFDAAIQDLADDLVETMRSYNRCVGLAAPQIGMLHRIIAIDVSGHPKTTECHGLLVLVNPQLLETSGGEVGREGCLSLPDITANVRRALKVRFEAQRPDGSIIEAATSGFEARALLHEIDHLDGILVLDRVASPAEVFSRRSR